MAVSVPGAIRSAALPLLTLALLLYRRWRRRGSSLRVILPTKSSPREDSQPDGPSYYPSTSDFSSCSSRDLIQPGGVGNTWALNWAGIEGLRLDYPLGLSASFVVTSPPAQPPQPSPALSELRLPFATPGMKRSTITQTIFTAPRCALTPGSALACLVDSMDEWKKDFLGQRQQLGHSTFWHRTSRKLVLSILALRLEEKLVFVRGCNLEVSLPSGSLCSERNAFGSALTMYPFLRRQHFLGIAVLSLTDGEANLNPLPPCGVCSAWIEKIHEVNQAFRVVTFSTTDLEEVHVTTMAPLGLALAEIRDCPAALPHAQPLSEAVELRILLEDAA